MFKPRAPSQPPEPSIAVTEYIHDLSAKIIAPGNGISPADIRTAVRDIGGNISRSTVRVSSSMDPNAPNGVV